MQELLPRSAVHHRGQAHDTRPNHQLITRQENACHNKGKKKFSRKTCYWDSFSGSISTFYKYGWVCPMCFGSKKKPKREKSVSFDASRISHDTGNLEFPTGPLVTPEKSVPEIFLRDFSGPLSFVKETKNEKDLRALQKSAYVRQKRGRRKEKKGSL